MLHYRALSFKYMVISPLSSYFKRFARDKLHYQAQVLRSNEGVFELHNVWVVVKAQILPKEFML